MFRSIKHQLNGAELFKSIYKREQLHPFHFRLVDYSSFTDEKLNDLLLSVEFEIDRVCDILHLVNKEYIGDCLKFVRDKVVLTIHMRKFLPCMYELIDHRRFEHDRDPKIPRWIINSNRRWNEQKLYLVPHTTFMRFATMLNGLSWEEDQKRLQEYSKYIGCSEGTSYTPTDIRLLYAVRQLQGLAQDDDDSDEE
ncbi:uncharacterized protein LOC126749041 [Anthonomus grandis grandis]|uniref:uncharacterized protein LOC126749041 n=1 Tax=Anthonomus grandis grandis TaxID=2921223 RepID=UPI002165E706|nr:uncharacterized protein LOC126749041 [Anthonomus grandis grandis]